MGRGGGVGAGVGDGVGTDGAGEAVGAGNGLGVMGIPRNTPTAATMPARAAKKYFIPWLLLA